MRFRNHWNLTKTTPFWGTVRRPPATNILSSSVTSLSSPPKATQPLLLMNTVDIFIIRTFRAQFGQVLFCKLLHYIWQETITLLLDSNCFRHPQFLGFRPPLPLLLSTPLHSTSSKVVRFAGAAAAAAAEDEEENGTDDLSNLSQSVVQGAAAASTAPGEDEEENGTNGHSQLPSFATVCGTEDLRYRGTRRYSHCHSRSFNSWEQKWKNEETEDMNHRSVSFLCSHWKFWVLDPGLNPQDLRKVTFQHKLPGLTSRFLSHIRNPDVW